MNKPILLITALALAGLMNACNDNDDIEDPCTGFFSLEIVETLDAVEGDDIGSITLKANGGNGSITYSLDGEDFQSSPVFTGLPADNYTVTARDELGCETNLDVQIQQVLPVSFSEDIEPILQTNCMITSCHCDGNPLCFDNYATVSANAEQIAKRTASRNMPPDYSGKVLTEDQILQIANWVNQGARDN